jgi:MATE family multidrug resistance protein
MSPQKRPFGFMLRRILVAGIPLSGVYVADLATESTDTAMVGRLGADFVAAVGLGGTLALIFASFCMALPGMVGVLVAERAAAGDRDGAAQAVQHGIWVALALTPPGLLFLSQVGPLLRLTGQDPAIADLAAAYAMALGTALFPWMAFSVLDYFVTALNRPTIALILAWIGVGMNALANYALIYGRLGFPALGVVGAALATGITALTTFLILATVIHRSAAFRDYPVFRRLHRFSPATFFEILRTGAPNGLAGIGDVVFGTVIAILVGRFSTDLLAASQIALTFNQFVFAFISGLGLALGYFVAELNGGNRGFEIRGAWLAAQAIALGFLGLVLVVSLAAPRVIIWIYLDLDDPANAAAIHWATVTLAIVSVTRLFRGALSITWRALSGLKDTLFPSLTGLACSWLLGLPLGYWLATRTALAGMGFLWSEAIGLFVAAALVGVRFWRRTGRRVATG